MNQDLVLTETAGQRLPHHAQKKTIMGIYVPRPMNSKCPPRKKWRNYSLKNIWQFLLIGHGAEVRLSVRKVVPTLTSTSTEIYLSMAGAKQLGDTGFILVPVGAVRPTVVCSGHYIALHRNACRGGLQARRERRPGLQVPEVFD
jgi:hypothetical protein